MNYEKMNEPMARNEYAIFMAALVVMGPVVALAQYSEKQNVRPMRSGNAECRAVRGQGNNLAR